MFARLPWLSPRPLFWGLKGRIELLSNVLVRDYAFNIGSTVGLILMSAMPIIYLGRQSRSLFGTAGLIIVILQLLSLYILSILLLRRGVYISEDLILVRWTFRKEILLRQECVDLKWEPFGMRPAEVATLVTNGDSVTICPIRRNATDSKFLFGGSSGDMAFDLLAQELGLNVAN